MWFPRRVFSHKHGATELIKDIAKLGYNEIILKCDGGPALKTDPGGGSKAAVREDDLGETRQLETVGRTEQPSEPCRQSQSKCW